jgi:hypothetical protein
VAKVRSKQNCKKGQRQNPERGLKTGISTASFTAYNSVVTKKANFFCFRGVRRMVRATFLPADVFLNLVRSCVVFCELSFALQLLVRNNCFR